MKIKRNKKPQPVHIKDSYKEVYSAGEGKTFLIYRISQVIPLEDEKLYASFIILLDAIR